MGTSSYPVVGIILAAGKGVRMKSRFPKVIHLLGGKPLISYVGTVLRKLPLARMVIVVNFQAARIKEILGEEVEYVEQKEPLGTGHAILSTRPLFKDFVGDLLIVYADTPFLKIETLQRLLSEHRRCGNAATLLTAFLSCPSGYGRIVRNARGGVERIVEEKDASAEEKKIKEVNSGVYCFHSSFLFEALRAIKPDNWSGEYYLTDAIGILRKRGLPVGAVKTEDSLEIMGINSRRELAQAEKILRDRNLEILMENGVTVIDPATTFIGTEVKVGKDTVIGPFTVLEGKTMIGKKCEIGPYTHIRDSIIADRVEVIHSVVFGSQVEAEAKIGPYAHLRPGTVVRKQARIGNFVEVKKSIIGKRSRAGHLSYLGDTTVGDQVNIGAGTITCNFNGLQKNPTVIEDRAFIGSGTILIAPVKVGKNAITGAGAVIPKGKDVPPDAIVVGIPAKFLKYKNKTKRQKSYTRK